MMTALAMALLQTATPDTGAARLPDRPFAVGEHLTYQGKLGLLKLGTATLHVVGTDSVRGVPSYHFRFSVQLKNMLITSSDTLDSWVGVEDFGSRRFVKAYEEKKRNRRQEYEIFPDEGYYRELRTNKTGKTPRDPLDDTSFFYFLRLLPLEVGKSYRFDRYFQQEKNPVTVHVLKREKMALPDGTKVACLVLNPVVDTRGLFSKRSDTKVWLTDDERRLPVQIRARLDFGTITLRLADMAQVMPSDSAGRWQATGAGSP